MHYQTGARINIIQDINSFTKNLYFSNNHEYIISQRTHTVNIFYKKQQTATFLLKHDCLFLIYDRK
jgi:hypothetical protein